MACLEASSVPVMLSTCPPSRSMSRRASAFASASEAALRLPEAFEELYTANPMAAMTTMIRTSKTPFMRPAYRQEKADPGGEPGANYAQSGVTCALALRRRVGTPAKDGPIALTDYAHGTDNAAW